MTIEQITDHAELAKERLPDQFSRATNLNNFFNVAGARTQELEDQLFNILDQRHLTIATGVQLDGIGQILDLEREVGETDIAYRGRLIARTGELAKSGEMENLIVPFKNLTGASSVWVSEYYPAGVQLVAFYDGDTVSAELDAVIVASMNIVKAAGINLTLQYAEETTYFELADESETDVNNNGPTSADHGFGDEALTEGGGLARVIT